MQKNRRRKSHAWAPLSEYLLRFTMFFFVNNRSAFIIAILSYYYYHIIHIIVRGFFLSAMPIILSEVTSLKILGMGGEG
jgi:hypothetical protein